MLTGPSASGYLVKVRPASARTAAIARAVAILADLGVPSVVPPLASVSGERSLDLERSSLSVYPYVAARTGVDAGVTADQWRRLGTIVRTLHQVRLPDDVERGIGRDRYRPAEVDVARHVDRVAAATTFDEPVAREIAAFWLAHRREILDLADRTVALGRQVRRLPSGRTVTHGDLHTWNILVDAAGDLWIVDWDELRLAPRERDLMFFVGGISTELVSSDATARFLEGYGEPGIDPIRLAYYRHAWAIQDIAGYAARVLLDASIDAAQRPEAAAIFLSLFRPGEILDLATSSRPGAGVA